MRNVSPGPADARDGAIQLRCGIGISPAGIEQLAEVQEYLGEELGGQTVNRTVHASEDPSRSPGRFDMLGLPVGPSTLQKIIRARKGTVA